jgi:hypothetical protein
MRVKIPFDAIGMAVLIFFAMLWGVERLTGIGRVVRSWSDPVLKRVGQTFSLAGWLAVAATGLATLALMLGPGWGFVTERTVSSTAAGAVCGFVWLFAYGAAAIVLNAFGVRVYPADSPNDDASNTGEQLDRDDKRFSG